MVKKKNIATWTVTFESKIIWFHVGWQLVKWMQIIY